MKIHTYAFEGGHRSGKGSQIEILKKKLEEMGIPCIAIRGAGSRPNTGEAVVDEYSKWWEKVLPLLKAPTASNEDWYEGSRRLAREVIVFRDRVLPRLASRRKSSQAVLLIDRSVLSHMAMIENDPEQQFTPHQIYGSKDKKGRKLPSTNEIFPDLMFYLQADSNTLIERLDRNDPKYDFRKRNIEAHLPKFDTAIKDLPPELQERIIRVNANETTEEIANVIEQIVLNHIHS